jgi:hypothetical protein
MLKVGDAGSAVTVVVLVAAPATVSELVPVLVRNPEVPELSV